MSASDDNAPSTPDVTSASIIEAERHRLASLLDAEIGKSLNLLLAQASVYEQSLVTNPQAQMVASVLASLARQALQQIRDLSAALHPVLLESLGLGPALELLVSQTLRTTPLRISWSFDRLPKRLAPPIELALFRAVQDMLTQSAHRSHATNINLRLQLHNDQLTLLYEDNGPNLVEQNTLGFALVRLRQLGIVVETEYDPQNGFRLVVTVEIPDPPLLTEREIDVLQWLAKGLSNKEIAARLDVTPRTINFHLDNIYSKLNVTSRTEAVMTALRYALVK